MSLSLAVLVSGSGSNLQSIIDYIQAGYMDARIDLVLSNKSDAYGLERAGNHGLPTRVVSPSGFSTREEYDGELIRVIRGHGAQAIALAGFMRLLTPRFIQAFKHRILNIHPALLPSFPGLSAQKQAVDYGVRLSGCTVHFVDEKMDHGPIIIQAAVPCLPGEDTDSLKERILALEHRIYPQALQWMAQDRLEVRRGQVFLNPCPSPRVHDCRGVSALVNPGLDPEFNCPE